MSADRHALRQDFLFRAVRLREPGHKWGQLHQSGDGPAGAAHTPGFQGQREGEQKCHGGRLEPLADPDGPDNRHGHQKIHVRPEAPGRAPCLWQDVPQRNQDRQEIRNPCQQWNLMDNA